MSNCYLWPDDHIHSTFFGEQTIILDLKNDQYILLEPSQTALFKNILNGKIVSTGESFSIDNAQMENLKELLDLNLFCSTLYDTPYPTPIPEQKDIKGMSNIDFLSPTKKFSFKLKTLYALWILLYSHLSIKLSFYRTIKKFAKYKKNKDFRIPSQKEIEEITETLNAACLLYPWKTKCLEWSVALATLCLKARYNCNLVIGVQNPPFYAHAWVECNGMVIADSQQLPQKMATILKEPNIGVS